jgi:lipoprotein-anchoring transpeptidase ErfK/SrfK
MRKPLLCSLVLAALAVPLQASAQPRGWQRAPVDPYAAEYEEVHPYGGGLFEMLMGGRTPHRPSYRPLQVDPYTGMAVEARPRRGTRGALTGLSPSYAFEPEYEGLGIAPDPRYERQMVRYSGPHRPGTIVIDTPSKFLYLVQPGGVAIRYGIGVGRPGFSWAGVKTVSMKREWPDWRPPAEMLRRRPDLPRHMPGGLDNPLGARALYLGSSLYRIHGTNEPHTIGRAVSSGCIRMLNEDVVDLYSRVRVGTRVVVI